MTRIDGEALLSCQCGHDIGGEHNSRGCYATVGYGTREQRRCDCPLTDGQDVPELVAVRVERIVREAQEKAWDEGASTGLRTPQHLGYTLTNPYRAALGGAS